MAPKHSSEGLGGDSSSPLPTPSSTGSNPSKVPLGDNSASQDIVNAARGRSDGFEMGGDRAIGSPPNWQGQESLQLYKMATDNNVPSTAQSIGHTWSHHGRELSQASNDLYSAISELGAVWIGQGAASAQSALVAIANSGSQASEAAHTMADRLAKQAAAAEEVKKMPQPKGYNPKTGMIDALAGGPAAMVVDQKAAADAADAVKQQQVQFFTNYTKSMSEVDSSTPSFGPESLGMKPTPTHNSVGGFGNVGGVHATSVGHGVSGGGTSFGSHGAVVGGSSGAPAGHVPDSGTFGTSGYTGGNPLSGGAGVGTGAVPAAPATPSVPTGGAGSGFGQALGAGALGGGLGLAGGR
ncbi:WXG100 family type VII secretion target, partial [Amycolatopsis samaneae]